MATIVVNPKATMPEKVRTAIAAHGKRPCSRQAMLSFINANYPVSVRTNITLSLTLKRLLADGTLMKVAASYTFSPAHLVMQKAAEKAKVQAQRAKDAEKRKRLALKAKKLKLAAKAKAKAKKTAAKKKKSAAKKKSTTKKTSAKKAPKKKSLKKKVAPKRKVAVKKAAPKKKATPKKTALAPRKAPVKVKAPVRAVKAQRPPVGLIGSVPIPLVRQPSGSKAPVFALSKAAAQQKSGAQLKFANKWQYEDRSKSGGPWHDYDAAGSNVVEEAYQQYLSNPATDVRKVYSGQWHYNVDFGGMLQTNLDYSTHTVRKIRRVAV